MSKICFGATNENNQFICETVLRAKLADDHDGALDDLNNKIDYLLDGAQQKDYLQGELIRACPLVQILDRDDNQVAATDNPVYEPAGIDITALQDKPAERQTEQKIETVAADGVEEADETGSVQQSDDQQVQSANSGSEQSAQKKAPKKSLARQIYNRMNGSKRKEIIDAMVSELNISKAHASTYYQSIKSE